MSTDYEAARAGLIDELRVERRGLDGELGPIGFDPRVLAAIGKVPREEFVPDTLKSRAYENRPLPIGQGQTISQPFIVALMTDLLQLKPSDRVLEIGTGSGYQSAVLAELVDRVYSVEVIPELAARAAATLTRLGYGQVVMQRADGYLGWPEHAPYDAVIVTAAPSRVPPPLLAQLKVGGRLVIPIGEAHATQALLLMTKQANGRVSTREILPVAFVPMTGPH